MTRPSRRSFLAAALALLGPVGPLARSAPADPLMSYTIRARGRTAGVARCHREPGRRGVEFEPIRFDSEVSLGPRDVCVLDDRGRKIHDFCWSTWQGKTLSVGVTWPC